MKRRGQVAAFTAAVVGCLVCHPGCSTDVVDLAEKSAKQQCKTVPKPSPPDYPGKHVCRICWSTDDLTDACYFYCDDTGAEIGSKCESNDGGKLVVKDGGK